MSLIDHFFNPLLLVHPQMTEMKTGAKMKRQSSITDRDYNQPRVLANGTLTKSNNVTGSHCNTPKVLSNKNFDYETATIKRNSHGLNNHRPIIPHPTDADKF